MALIAYHGNPFEKDAILAQLRRHRLADEIVRGVYWENGKGCAVGCTVYSGSHEQYEPRFGIPATIALLEERIFEGLANEEAKLWPERLMGAIVPGSDLSRVPLRFLHWLLTDPLVNPGIEHRHVRDAVAQCAAVLADWIEMGAAQESAAWKASRAVTDAKDAAWELSLSASAVNAALAGWGAVSFAAFDANPRMMAIFWIVWSVEHAAKSAAYARIWDKESEAWDAARRAAFAMMANKLVALIEEEGRTLAVLPLAPHLESAHA